MKPEEAIKLLIDAVNLAQARGAYNLKESATILPAVETFTSNPSTNMNTENIPDVNPNAVNDGSGVIETPVVEATPEVVEVAPVVDEGPVEDTESVPVEAPTEEVAA